MLEVIKCVILVKVFAQVGCNYVFIRLNNIHHLYSQVPN